LRCGGPGGSHHAVARLATASGIHVPRSAAERASRVPFAAVHIVAATLESVINSRPCFATQSGLKRTLADAGVARPVRTVALQQDSLSSLAQYGSKPQRIIWARAARRLPSGSQPGSPRSAVYSSQSPSSATAHGRELQLDLDFGVVGGKANTTARGHNIGICTALRNKRGPGARLPRAFIAIMCSAAAASSN
jgi:hypothetical protein